MSDDWLEALPPYAKDVIASAEHDECDEESFARMNRKVLSAALVGAGAAAGTGVASAAASTVAKTSGATLAAKAGVTTVSVVFLKSLASIVIAAGVLGGGLWAASDGSSSAKSADEAAAEGTPQADRHEERSVELPVEEAVEEVVEEAVLDQEPEAPALEEASEEHRASSAPPRRAAVEERAPRAEENVAPTTLGDELRLLQELRRSVRTNAVQALQLADEHETRYGTSDLGPERELHRIRALILLGRESAARRAQERFRSAFPGSPYGPRIDSLVQEQ